MVILLILQAAVLLLQCHLHHTTGDSIGIIDYAGTAASNTIILTSSNNIQGSSNDKIVNYTRGALRITYADVTQGWVASAAANEGTSALNPSPFLK